MLQPFLHLNEAWNLVYQTQQVSKNAAISHFHRCPRFDLVSVICVVEPHTGLQFPLFFLLFFLVPPLLLERGCWWWVQFLIHIGSGRWIWSSCSPALFHFKLELLFQLTQWLHGYSKWMNMLGTRGERIYLSKKNDGCVILFFPFSSAETLIISKTANIRHVFVWTPCVYSSPRL